MCGGGGAKDFGGKGFKWGEGSGEGTRFLFYRDHSGSCLEEGLDGSGKPIRKHSTVQAGSKLGAGFAGILFSIFSLGDQNISVT